MKNIIKRFSFLLVLSFIAFSFIGMVQAQTFELPETGMLPDSPFYFLKSWGEGIGTFFTFGNLNKAERFFELSERRLAEVKALTEKERPEEAEKALERYQEQIARVIERTGRAKQRGDNVDDVLSRVSERTLKHQEVLSDVYEKVPEQARPAIERAIRASARGHEEALDAVSGEKREEIQERIEEVKREAERRREEVQERVIPEDPVRTLPESKEDFPQELVEVLGQLEGLSVKYKQTTRHGNTPISVANVWQKGPKIRIEVSDGPMETITIADVIEGTASIYMPATNTIMRVDDKDAESFVGAFYNPIVVGSESLEGMDVLVIEHTIAGITTKQWISKDYGITMKSETTSKVDPTPTVTLTSDIEPVTIPDSMFLLPAGAEEWSIPEIDMEEMMEGMEGMEDIMKEMDIEGMMEGMDMGF